MPWLPGDPWPSGTLGGAWSPHWGGYVRLWIRAALAAGNVLHAGPHTYDRLDAGNVLGGAPTGPTSRSPESRATTSRLWVDVSCDVLDVDVQGGASSSAGIFTKPDAATCVVTLADPTRKYDPLNGDGPYALGGQSRLVPGTPVDVFAEVVDGDTGAWSRHWLFTGTADSWGEDLTPARSSRRAKLVATGESKAFVNMNRPPTEPAVGAGDTVAQRVARIVAESGWLGDVEHGVGTVTLAATTLEGDGWAQLNDTLDDEIGFVYFTGDGALRWVGRATWLTIGEPVVELGCTEGAYDVLVDASPSALDLQLRNYVFAARAGGPTATASSATSISRYGRFDYSRTDLGLATDAQVAEWARLVLQLYAYPQISLADVTAVPAIAGADSGPLWAALLALEFASDLVRIYWVPPDDLEGATAPVDALSRVVGFHHRITRTSWELQLQLVDAEALAYAGVVLAAGPDANDRLDAGFVYG